MRDLRTWFSNPFADRNISYVKLNLFAADCIARLTNNNGSGLFTAILAQLVTAYQGYFGDINDVDLANAIQKSFTAAKDNVFNTFKATVSQQEGLVRSTFGKDDPIYLEFFPLGLSEYSKATLGNVETLINRLVDRGQAHSAQLGSGFLNTFQNIQTNYQAARTAQLGRKSTTSDQRTERHGTRAELETELFRAVFAVGMNFPGDVDRCMDFFDQTIIRSSNENDDDDATIKVSGRVTIAASGTPIVNARVVLAGGGGAIEVFTGVGGYYTIEVPNPEAPEAGTLSVSATGFMSASSPVTINPDEDRNEDFGLHPAPPTP